MGIVPHYSGVICANLVTEAPAAGMYQDVNTIFVQAKFRCQLFIENFAYPAYFYEVVATTYGPKLVNALQR